MAEEAIKRISMAEFILDERLNSDTFHLIDWPLCRVLLMNDSQYPWCILVPRSTKDSGEQVTELFELSDMQRSQLDKESVALSRFLMDRFSGQKLNVAALGNVVSQLHIHHVVRFQNDASWPAPIWGRLPALPYSEKAASDLVLSLRAELALLPV